MAIRLGEAVFSNIRLKLKPRNWLSMKFLDHQVQIKLESSTTMAKTIFLHFLRISIKGTAPARGQAFSQQQKTTSKYNLTLSTNCTHNGR